MTHRPQPRTLRITPRSSLLVLIADPTLDRPYRIESTGPAPRVREHADGVDLDYSLAGRIRSLVPRSSLAVALSPAHTWAIELIGGVSGLRAGLGGLPLSSIAITGGATDIALDLPHPDGRLALDVGGGMSSAVVRRPAGVPVSVRVDGGATGLRLDGDRLGAVDGTVRRRIAPAHTGGEIVVHVRGGASRLTVEAVETDESGSPASSRPATLLSGP